jgi:hypothetical protein
MKFINSFCGTVIVFVILLITAYSGIAIGANLVEDLYTVKINSVPIRRDVAEGILLRINSNYKDEGISVRSNNGTNILKKIERNIDISIEDNKLLSDLSNLYKSGLDKGRNVCRECVLDNNDFKEKTRRIQIRTNKDGVVSYLAVL